MHCVLLLGLQGLLLGLRDLLLGLRELLPESKGFVPGFVLAVRTTTTTTTTTTATNKGQRRRRRRSAAAAAEDDDAHAHVRARARARAHTRTHTHTHTHTRARARARASAQPSPEVATPARGLWVAGSYPNSPRGGPHSRGRLRALDTRRPLGAPPLQRAQQHDALLFHSLQLRYQDLTQVSDVWAHNPCGRGLTTGRCDHAIWTHLTDDPVFCCCC